MTERPLQDEQVGQRLVLGCRPVAPVHLRGLRERGHLLDPFEQLRVGGQGGRRGRHGKERPPRGGPARYLSGRRGTSTSRLNSATSTPSWLSTRVCTLT